MAKQKPKNILDDIIGLLVKAARKTKNAAKDPMLAEKIVIHGSDTSGLKTLKPQYGSYMKPDDEVLWLYEALKGADKTSQGYLNGVLDPTFTGEKMPSIYMGKTPEMNLWDEGDDVRTMKKPLNILKEITTSNKSEEELLKEFHKMMRRQGIRIPKR